MEQKTYLVRGVLHGRRQPEEHFTSEAHARRRAAYLGTIYDSVVVDRHQARWWYGIRRRPADAAPGPDGVSSRQPEGSAGGACAHWWAALRRRLRHRGPGAG